jgi:hypothetical protein
MKVLELSIGKLTVIERVNWSWFAFYAVFVTYCLCRYLDTGYVAYPFIKLFLVNKFFGLKSGCTKKLYWEGRRIINAKTEDLIAVGGIFIGICLAKVVSLCSGVGFHAGEFTVLSSQLCIDVFEVFVHILHITLFATLVATLCIGLLKRVKR